MGAETKGKTIWDANHALKQPKWNTKQSSASRIKNAWASPAIAMWIKCDKSLMVWKKLTHRQRCTSLGNYSRHGRCSRNRVVYSKIVMIKKVLHRLPKIAMVQKGWWKINGRHQLRRRSSNIQIMRPKTWVKGNAPTDSKKVCNILSFSPCGAGNYCQEFTLVIPNNNANLSTGTGYPNTL